MTDLTQSVNNESDLNRFFTMIENMADDDLGPYEYRLLAHYKRVCGANYGTCTQSVRTTAAICQMSIGQVSKTRRDLETKGWLRVKVHTKISPNNKKQIVGISVTLINRMAENIERYTQENTCSYSEQGCSHTEQGCSCGETKKNIKQEEQKQKQTKESFDPFAPRFNYSVGDSAYWVEELSSYQTITHEITIVRFTTTMVYFAYVVDGNQFELRRKPNSISRIEPKLERKTTPIEDTLAICIFGVNETQPIGKLLSQKLKTYRSEILTPYPTITPEQIKSAFKWKGERFKPSDPAMVVKMLGDYRDSITQGIKGTIASETNANMPTAAKTRAAIYERESA